MVFSVGDRVMNPRHDGKGSPIGTVLAVDDDPDAPYTVRMFNRYNFRYAEWELVPYTDEMAQRNTWGG